MTILSMKTNIDRLEDTIISLNLTLGALLLLGLRTNGAEN